MNMYFHIAYGIEASIKVNWTEASIKYIYATRIKFILDIQITFSDTFVVF